MKREFLFNQQGNLFGIIIDNQIIRKDNSLFGIIASDSIFNIDGQQIGIFLGDNYVRTLFYDKIARTKDAISPNEPPIKEHNDLFFNKKNVSLSKIPLVPAPNMPYHKETWA